MTAHEKIAEAEYFLNRLPSLPLNVLGFEVSAFLSAACSIFDHSLEDYRCKFQLGDIKHLSADTFEKRAKKMRNERALEFIKWHRKQMDSIRNDHRFLFESRNRSIHIESPRQSFRVETKGPITVEAERTASIPFVVPPLGLPTKVEATVRRTNSGATERVTQLEASTTAFFEGMPDKDLLVLCKDLLIRGKQMIQQAELVWGEAATPHKLTDEKTTHSS